MKESHDGEVVTYSHDRSEEPGFVRSDYVVTSVRVRPSGKHDRVSIWNRGGLSGEVVVDAGDGVTIAKRLLDGGVR